VARQATEGCRCAGRDDSLQQVGEFLCGCFVLKYGFNLLVVFGTSQPFSLVRNKTDPLLPFTSQCNQVAPHPHRLLGILGAQSLGCHPRAWRPLYAIYFSRHLGHDAHIGINSTVKTAPPHDSLIFTLLHPLPISCVREKPICRGVDQSSDTHVIPGADRVLHYVFHCFISAGVCDQSIGRPPSGPIDGKGGGTIRYLEGCNHASRLLCVSH
jgi:hypothetical protein